MPTQQPTTVTDREFSNALSWLEEETLKIQRRADQNITLHPHEERTYKLMHCVLLLYRMCEELEHPDYDAPQQGA